MQALGPLLRHPRLLVKKAIGRLRRRIMSLPASPVIKPINGKVRYEFVCLPFLADEDFRAMLTGSYDLILREVLRTNLSSGDIVLDVGANVGYISALAASYVGTSGEVHGFEPLSICFNRLQNLKELNPEFHFVFSNIALGAEEGVLPISYDPNGESRNASLLPGPSGVATQNVPVKRLDDYIRDCISSPRRIKLIKIDVEGFEFFVLKGLQRFFAETDCRPLIVCELKPWELKKLGYTIADFDGYMKKFGYSSYDMVDQEKPLELAKLTDMEVVLFRASAR